MELQYEDSQIAEEVMVTFAKQQGLVPLLPVHDSFICHHGYKKDVLKLMHDIFKIRYGVKIEIKTRDRRNVVYPETGDNDLSEMLSYQDASYTERLDNFLKNQT